jgi:hypothetical protein
VDGMAYGATLGPWGGRRRAGAPLTQAEGIVHPGDQAALVPECRPLHAGHRPLLSRGDATDSPASLTEMWGTAECRIERNISYRWECTLRIGLLGSGTQQQILATYRLPVHAELISEFQLGNRASKETFEGTRNRGDRDDLKLAGEGSHRTVRFWNHGLLEP